MSSLLHGARVVVTAGGQGIGYAITEQFLAAGARVFICDVESDRLAAARSALPGVGTAVADVAQPADVAALFTAALGHLGGIDVLVNNAGIGGLRAAVEDIEDAEWARVMAVNIGGAFHCVKQAVPPMKAQGSGCIINISTSSVRTGLPMRTSYVTSKHGVMGLTQNLARELGPAGIRVNAILPGLIDNARGRALVQRAADEAGVSFAEAEVEALRCSSMRCWIDPHEVGDLAVFLASDAARHISGQFIGVCGNAEWEA
jgi:NAD(P)-dependent dehydrogenase (short-subunit alcohol dehydrogenase family)